MATRGVFDDQLVGPALAQQFLQANSPLSAIKALGRASLSLTPAQVAAGTSVEQTFPLAGVVIGDSVVVNPQVFLAGVLVLGARVVTNGSIAVTFANVTAGALTPPAGIYTVLVVR
jgi:hypothetical protein